jgi:hypothetical protein
VQPKWDPLNLRQQVEKAPQPVLLVFGAFAILIMLFVTRLNLQSDFFPYPYLFCDEAIYVDESLRMNTDVDFFPNEFRAGIVNFALPLALNSLGIQLDIQSIFELGRVVYTVLLPTLSIGLLLIAIYIFSNSILLTLTLVTAAGFSPLFLSISMYWYPDSYISIWISALLLVLVARERNKISRESSSGLMGLIFAFGLATKLTFMAILAIFLMLYWKELSYKSGGRTSQKFIFLSSFSISSAILFIPAFERNLLFLRGQFINVGVYQSGSRDFLSGIEFYGSFLLIAALLPLAFALPGFRSACRNSKTVVFSLASILVYVTIFALQTQYLVRNLNLISPLIFFFCAACIHFTRQRVREYGIYALASLISLQTAIALAWVHSSQLATDPRVALWSKERIAFQVVGTGNTCSRLEDSPYLEMLVDERMDKQLDTYLFSSFDADPIFTEFDPVSWKRPLLTGVEFVQKDNFVFMDYLDLNEPKLHSGVPQYTTQILPGRHAYLYLLERE